MSEGFNHSTYPVWTPDGKHLLFWGNNSETYKDMDWWVVPLAGGAAVRTGLAKVLAQHQLEPDVRSVGDWTWFHNNLVLSARQADSTNLWSIPISPETFQITGRPQRLTFGAGEDVLPSIATDGRIVFATLRKNVQIWSLPADVNAGVIRGAIEQLTTDTVSKRWPAISPDGRYVVFTAPRGGRDELWLRDLRTGQERTVATGIVGVFSKDGSEIAFGPTFPRHGEKVGIYVVRTQDGVPEKICEECGYPTDWSHDSRRIMYNISPRGDPSWLDLKSGEKHGFLRHRVYALWDGQFSPDDRWVAFGALKHEGPVQIFVTPFPDGTGSHENAWIPITDGSADAGHLVWSPDGRLLYFASDRDGRMCLWAQALDQSMRPRGPAIAILHLHGPRRSIENMPWNQFRLSTSRDTLLFNLGELTGNIWMTRLGQK